MKKFLYRQSHACFETIVMCYHIICAVIVLKTEQPIIRMKQDVSYRFGNRPVLLSDN